MSEYLVRKYRCAICSETKGMACESDRETSLICENCRMVLLDDLTGGKAWENEGTKLTKIGERIMEFIELIGAAAFVAFKRTEE